MRHQLISAEPVQKFPTGHPCLPVDSFDALQFQYGQPKASNCPITPNIFHKYKQTLHIYQNALRTNRMKKDPKHVIKLATIHAAIV